MLSRRFRFVCCCVAIWANTSGKWNLLCTCFGYTQMTVYSPNYSLASDAHKKYPKNDSTCSLINRWTGILCARTCTIETFPYHFLFLNIRSVCLCGSCPRSDSPQLPVSLFVCWCECVPLYVYVWKIQLTGLDQMHGENFLRFSFVSLYKLF